MSDFPESPLAPTEFMEQWLPRAFAEAPLPDDAKQVGVALGVLLAGDGGGEWVLRVESDGLDVRAGSRADTAFTLVLRVDDWRGALWEGRGGLIGRGAAGLFRADLSRLALGAGGAPTDLAPVLEQLRGLEGVIRLVVTGDAGGDWWVDLKLGPGEIPEEPATTVSVSNPDLERMQSGELDPMEAFMAGRIQVTGDLALVMQMQAVLMQAAAEAAARHAGPAT